MRVAGELAAPSPTGMAAVDPMSETALRETLDRQYAFVQALNEPADPAVQLGGRWAPATAVDALFTVAWRHPLDFRIRSEHHGGMAIAASRPMATRRSSDLSKHSAEVFAEAEDHPVTVTRRDGEALVLMSQREAEGRSRLLNFAAQLITVTLDDRGSLAERMSRAFPWMLALSPADRESCAQELVDAARASLSTDQPHLVIAELTSWKETATAVAAGLGSADLEWLDEDESVERP